MRPHKPRQLDDVLAPGDFVIAVCDNAHEELPTDVERLHWSIPDPVRKSTDTAFDHTLDELTERIGRLATTLSPVS
jgi:protein-tyrosine-phosphatase